MLELGRAGSLGYPKHEPLGRWSSRPTLTADDALPPHQQVFLLWGELVLSRRAAAAAGGVTAVTIAGAR